jgi:SRSO17 transposase
VEGLAGVAGHADRKQPLSQYLQGLLLPGERKSVEPMAARLAPDQVSRTHQSLHHLVAEAPWDDQVMLAQVRKQVLPSLTQHGPIAAWIVDDTGMPKYGNHSVGVAHQYCGQLGKQANCQVAVSLSISTWQASLPIAWRLYLSEAWCADQERRTETGVPEQVQFQTKPALALEQIRQALADQVPVGVVLADAAYGHGMPFRSSLTGLGMQYIVGIESHAVVWGPGQVPPLPAKPKKLGRRSRNAEAPSPAPQAVSVKALAENLPAATWQTVEWRQGSQDTLSSRFAAVRVHPAHGDLRSKRTEPYPEEWLLMEWPEAETAPTRYWLSTLPASTVLTLLVKTAKHRWIIERDYLELKQELGLGHYEGRSWRGFHHHATLCIAAYGFLLAERSLFSPSTHPQHLGLRIPRRPDGFRPRGAPRSPGEA